MASKIIKTSGLTGEEQQVMDHLVGAYNGFRQLESQHPDEMTDFLSSIHRVQDLLAVRAMRRLYPESWPTHHKEEKG